MDKPVPSISFTEVVGFIAIGLKEGKSQALELVENRRRQLRGDENVLFEFDQLVDKIKELMKKD